MEEPKPLQEGLTKGNKKNYKQKHKRTGQPPKPFPKTNTKENVKEIPLYDPYTGEPNPYYEELTGKKNPLIELRKREYGIHGSNHVENKSIEYGRGNRFLLKLPKEFNIEPFFINSVSGPRISYENVKILGITLCLKRYKVEDIDINFKIPVSGKILKNLHELGKKGDRFSFSIEILDPTNIVYETWKFDGCIIGQIDMETLSYENGGLIKGNLKISASNYTIK
jgi:hypothetical protein